MPADHFDDVEFHIDTSEPSEKLLLWAKKNNGETGNDRRVKLRKLRGMILERNVTPHRTDDAFFLRFLRRKDFNLTKAYDLLVNYCNFRKNYPELYEGLNPFRLLFIAKDDVISILPYREQTGKRILIYKIGLWKIGNYDIDKLFQLTLTILELAILEQRTQILGGICIFDMQGIGVNLIGQVTPSVVSKVLHLIVTSFPIKIRAIHIIFESWIFNIVYKIFQPLLTKKVKDRIFFHGNDVESLHKHIDLNYLPCKYGGIRPDYKFNDWVASIAWREDIIKELESLGYHLDRKDIEDWRGRKQNSYKARTRTT